MIRLSPSCDTDLDFVLACESDDVAERFVTQWTRELHRQALQDPDCIHRIILAAEDGARVGFALIFGVSSPHRSIELRRVVCTRKNAGLGRATLRAVKQLAFVDLGAHRLWLDVKSHNARARHLYASEGFIEEGVLRECLLTDQGYESMVLMSILSREYFQPGKPATSTSPSTSLSGAPGAPGAPGAFGAAKRPT